MNLRIDDADFARQAHSNIYILRENGKTNQRVGLVIQGYTRSFTCFAH